MINRRISFQKLVCLFVLFFICLCFVFSALRILFIRSLHCVESRLLSSPLACRFTGLQLGNHPYIKTERTHLLQLNSWFLFSFAATCTVNNNTYNLGDTIVLHNVTDPVEHAKCDVCNCSTVGITDCEEQPCDLVVEPSLCDNWITKEGRCCPICGEK